MGRKFKKGGGRFKRKVAIKKHDPESKVKLDPWDGKVMDKAPSKKDRSLVQNLFKNASPFEEVSLNRGFYEKRKCTQKRPHDVIKNTVSPLKEGNKSISMELSSLSKNNNKVQLTERTAPMDGNKSHPRDEIPKSHRLPVLDMEAVKQREERRKTRKVARKKEARQEGESKKEYARRMALEREKKEEEARRKMNGNQRKEKVKQHNLKRKQKNKKKIRTPDDSISAQPVTKPAFGEVVDRPPLFDKAVKNKMCSLVEKSKSRKTMADYANEVKASYELLKLKRREQQEAQI